MASYRLYKELIGVEMLYSGLSYGGATYTKFLIDSGSSFTTNFVMSAALTGVVPPTTTAGLVENASFIFRTPFETRTRIEGPIWGNMCFKLENNVTSSYKTVFTEATITLSAVSSDGTARVLINAAEIYPKQSAAADIELVGTGSLQSETYGFFFTSYIDCTVEPTELLVLNLKTYGYKNSTSTTHKIYTLVDKSDQDLKLLLPLVGM